MPKRKASSKAPPRARGRPRLAKAKEEEEEDGAAKVAPRTVRTSRSPRKPPPPPLPPKAKPRRRSVSPKPQKAATSSSAARNTPPNKEEEVSSSDSTKEEEENAEDDASLVTMEEEIIPPPTFNPCQKVFARDEDGLLYPAIVRRRLWGIHQHKQVQVGMVTSQHEIDLVLQQEVNASWHYFVHYANWKVNWDRWVEESDMLEWNNDANIALAKRIAQEHKALQQQFKAAKNSKTIDGGAFLKAWKPRLETLLATTTTTKPKKVAAKSQKYTKKAMEKESQLRTHHGLSHRKPREAQQIVLSFGLKKILVEEWELIHQFEMVPSQLPAKVTIRQALDLYLESKAVPVIPVVNNHNHNHKKAKKEPTTKEEEEEDSTEQETTTTTTASSSSLPTDRTPEEMTSNTSTSSPTDVNDQTTSTATHPPIDDETLERNKEWIDMANGIALFFDQALPFRLLYPSEKYQLAVLETRDDYFLRTSKSELYGCEHLLRLFCRLPSILADAYTGENDDDDNDEDTVKPILAKLNDLARFLQKNQSTLFCQSYRKQNDDERRHEQKITKRHERKRKLLLGQQQQATAVAAEAEAEATL